MCEGDNCCYRVVRILLFVFTFIFVVTGIILLAMGIVLHVQGDSYATLLPSLEISMSALLIIIGIIIFIVAFLGCCGALRQSRWMLITFLVCLIIIFILEIVAGILAFQNKSKVEEFVTNDLVAGLPQYQNSSAFMDAWDTVQQQLECCGVNKPSDWYTETSFFSVNQYPDSCCVKEMEGCGSEGADIFTDGCKGKVVAVFEGNLSTVAGLGIAIALFEIMGMVCACCMLRGYTSYTSASV